jgi:phage FluMu gp28-like protein
VSSSSVVTLTLPEPHPSQAEILASTRRFNVVACGRRFGKSELAILRLTETALHGEPCAYFAPTYKMLAEVWREFLARLEPVTKNVNVQERRLDLVTGGSIDFWSLDAPNTARGRRYARVVIDEAAMVADLDNAWNAAIRPTLADLYGDADFYSTPRGRGFFWTAFARGESRSDPEWGAWRFPTSANPYIGAEEIEAARRQLPDRVFRQEFLAEFLDDSGGVFRRVREAIDLGRVQPIPSVPGNTYCLGVDLARVQDFTVITVIDAAGRQVYFERFNQISWERQIAAILAVADRYPGVVVVDSTGVGDPICEALQRSPATIQPYPFTNQSKEAAINRLALRLEQGRLQLMDIETQTNELLAFQYELTPARNVRMSAPEGMHDDCVMALALTCWGAERYAYAGDVATPAPLPGELEPAPKPARSVAEMDDPRWWGSNE